MRVQATCVHFYSVHSMNLAVLGGAVDICSCMFPIVVAAVTHVACLQAGLKAAYINRSNTPFPGFFPQPDAEFTSFEHLAKALGK